MSDDVARIGSTNAVYLELEVKNATLRADAQGRMAWSIAAAARFATEFRYPMGSAAWIDQVI